MQGASNEDLEKLNEAVSDIISGTAICFLGAGFSREASDQNGKSVPDVSQLSLEICRFPGLEGEEGAPLVDLAEFCEGNPDLKVRLTALLVERLTLCTATPEQSKLLNLPWRSIFTTNFDDIAEQALGDLAKPVTPNFDSRNLSPSERPIYYLHGRARDILEGASDPSIVLSEKNYLELKDKNIRLYSALENEIHAASRIFFVGYSVRDAEIASRLFSIPRLAAKSVVICGPNEKQVSLQRLKKFGHVYPIGVNGFAEILPEDAAALKVGNSIKYLGYVKKISPSTPKEDVDAFDVERLILSGEFSQSAYGAQKRFATSEPLYCVSRESHVDTIFSSTGINRFLVTADLGNGKSVFVEQVIFRAQEMGYQIFKIDTQLSEVYAELNELLVENVRRVYLVDGFARYRRVAKFIGERLKGNSLLIVTSGYYVDEYRYSEITNDLGGAVREVDINTLSSSELKAWDHFLERWGYWDKRIEESANDRADFLRIRCGAENRSIVLALFSETRLSQKIDSIVSFFLTKNKQLSRSFIAILINSLCSRHVEWSRIVQWLDIDEADLRSKVRDSPVGDFMTGAKRWYEFTSTELADHILNNYNFDAEEVVDVYTTIVRQTAYSSTDARSGYDARENLKELMRFRFLTRLFEKQQEGVKSISAVYHRLAKVPRIRENDQFWLQYAMACMEIGDLSNAETYLGTAIGLANRKGEGYSKRQILDQHARLLFRKNALVVRESEMLEASGILKSLLNEKNEPFVHPLRSAGLLLNVLEAQADKLKPQIIEELRSLVLLMKSSLTNSKLEKAQKGETEVIRKNIRDCGLILGNL